MALSRGPYGAEVLHHAWLLYATLSRPSGLYLMATCVRMAGWRRPTSYWAGADGLAELQRLLVSRSREDIARGLFTCIGLLWEGWDGPHMVLTSGASAVLLPKIEQNILHEDPAIWAAAVWAWASAQASQTPAPHLSPVIADHLLMLWLSDAPEAATTRISLALCTLRQPRSTWTPVLTDEQLLKLRNGFKLDVRVGIDYHYSIACMMVAFYARTVVSDKALVARTVEVESRFPMNRMLSAAVESMLTQLGEVGQKRLGAWRRARMVKAE